MSTWKIEYEIPPLRAIYFAEMEAEKEQEVRDAVAQWEPLWKIRKLTSTTPLHVDGNAMVLARLDRGGRLARNVCARFWKNLQPIKVQINPCFLERSMDWPIGWTELKPLGTDKYLQWFASHGKPSPPPDVS